MRTTGKHIKRLTAMLNRQYRRGDQQVQDLIHAEAHISASLRHPHLIPMVDFGFEEEVPYLVMMEAVKVAKPYERENEEEHKRKQEHIQSHKVPRGFKLG